MTEVALGGASGTGKTAMAWINMAYQFYLLSCFKSPQRAFGLASITPVVFTVQSLQWSITDRVIYRPFRAMLVNMPYVKRYCPFDTLKESRPEVDRVFAGPQARHVGRRLLPDRGRRVHDRRVPVWRS